MNNLFSIFDPVSIFGLRINWGSRALLALFILPCKFWLASNQQLKIFTLIGSYLVREVKLVLGGVRAPGVSHLVVRIFWFIAINNLFGLIPYIFTATRHLVTTLSIGLTLWLAIMGGAIIRDLGRTLAHLVPQGTPYPLIPLIVLIELVRNFIRPATLSIRLAANMVAGHLLLTLAGGSASILSPSITLVSMVVITLIIVLELAVALIQSYVFSTLSSLYIGDVNSVKTAI